MSVYVDDVRLPLGRMVMCHMTADTHEELVGMAEKIGVHTRWIQYPGEWKEHFDISLTKRALAVKNGAVEVSVVERVKAMLAAHGR